MAKTCKIGKRLGNLIKLFAPYSISWDQITVSCWRALLRTRSRDSKTTVIVWGHLWPVEGGGVNGVGLRFLPFHWVEHQSQISFLNNNFTKERDEFWSTYISWMSFCKMKRGKKARSNLTMSRLILFCIIYIQNYTACLVFLFIKWFVNLS